MSLVAVLRSARSRLVSLERVVVTGMVVTIAMAMKVKKTRRKKKKIHTQKSHKMILLNHCRPLPPLRLVLQILLVPLQRALLHDARIDWQIRLVEQTLRIADALLQLVDGRVLVVFFGQLQLLPGVVLFGVAVAMIFTLRGVAAVAVGTGCGDRGLRSGAVARHGCCFLLSC